MRSLHVAAIGLFLGVAACHPPKRAYTESDMDGPTKDAPDASASAAAEPELPPGSVARSQVDEWLLRGPSYLFQRVRISDVHKGNKFVGWRLEQFPSEWDASGLHAGDVVTSANGVTLESQDDFFDAWVKVSGADEVHIAYERDGKPGEAVLKIVGEADPTVKQKLEEGAPPSPTAHKMSSNPQRRGTIIITEETGAQNAD